MSIPAGFMDSGEVLTSEFDAQVAAHDYAHEGYYFRIVRISDRRWGVYLLFGRQNRPACCKRKRTYVSEPVQLLWEPRSTPELRHKTGKMKIS